MQAASLKDLLEVGRPILSILLLLLRGYILIAIKLLLDSPSHNSSTTNGFDLGSHNQPSDHRGLRQNGGAIPCGEEGAIYLYMKIYMCPTNVMNEFV